MILGIGTEAGVFLYAGLSGMTVMFAYGILSCLRRLIPHSLRMVGAEDLFFSGSLPALIFSMGCMRLHMGVSDGFSCLVLAQAPGPDICWNIS